MSFLFAASEVLDQPGQLSARAQHKQRMLRNPKLFLIHSICSLIIIVAGIWAFIGVNVGELTKLYIGEVASVWAFGLSWILAGYYLTAPARPGPLHAPEHHLPTRDAVLSK